MSLSLEILSVPYTPCILLDFHLAECSHCANIQPCNVISEKALREFWQKHSDAPRISAIMAQAAKRAKWQNLAEVRQTSNSADVTGIDTIFNIKGNAYRLITAIHYNRQKVYIRHVFTHAEYDRWNKG